MKEYQRQKNNKWLLPNAVYYQTLWKIRDYYRLKRQADEVIRQAKESDGMPRNGDLSDPVLSAVEKRERLLSDVRMIDAELARIPQEYRDGVWNSIVFGKPYPNYAAPSTFGVYKSRFIHGVAVRFGYID